MPKHTITREMETLLLGALATSKDSRAVTDELIPLIRDSPTIQVDKSSSKSLYDTIRWALIGMCDRDGWVTRPFGDLDSDKRKERMAWIRTNRPQQAVDQQVWEITDRGRAHLRGEIFR